MFAVEQEIASAVVGELKPRLLGKKAAASSVKSTNPEVYNAYLQGRYFFGHRNKEIWKNQSIIFDRRSSSIRHIRRSGWGWRNLTTPGGRGVCSRRKGYQSAREAVNRAVQLDPNMVRPMRPWVGLNALRLELGRRGCRLPAGSNAGTWERHSPWIRRGAFLHPGPAGRSDLTVPAAIVIDPLNSVASGISAFTCTMRGSRQRQSQL